MKSINSSYLKERSDDLYIVTPDHYLMVWLRANDEMIYRRPMGNHRTSSNCSDKSMSQTQIDRFIQDFNEETQSKVVARFMLNDVYMSALCDTIRLCNATHVRFHSDGDSVTVTVFDLRKYVDAIGIPLSKNRPIHEKVITGSHDVSKFSFSMRVETFLQLAENGSDIEILENGLGVFVGLEENLECFVRDQKIREPLIRFTNEKLDREIVFLSRQKTVQT